jgi:hypothetical protein
VIGEAFGFQCTTKLQTHDSQDVPLERNHHFEHWFGGSVAVLLYILNKKSNNT